MRTSREGYGYFEVPAGQRIGRKWMRCIAGILVFCLLWTQLDFTWANQANNSSHLVPQLLTETSSDTSTQTTQPQPQQIAEVQKEQSPVFREVPKEMGVFRWLIVTGLFLVCAIGGTVGATAGMYKTAQFLAEYSEKEQVDRKLEAIQKKAQARKEGKKVGYVDEYGFKVKKITESSLNPSLKYRGIDEDGFRQYPAWEIFEAPATEEILQGEPRFIKVYYDLAGNASYSTAVSLKDPNIVRPYNKKYVASETLYQVFFAVPLDQKGGNNAVYSYDVSHLGRATSDIQTVIASLSQTINGWKDNPYLKEVTLYQHGQRVHLFKNQFTTETLQGTWWSRYQENLMKNSPVGKVVTQKFTTELVYTVRGIPINLMKPPYMVATLSKDHSVITISFYKDRSDTTQSLYTIQVSADRFSQKEALEKAKAGKDGELERQTKIDGKKALNIFSWIAGILAGLFVFNRLFKGFFAAGKATIADPEPESKPAQEAVSGSTETTQTGPQKTSVKEKKPVVYRNFLRKLWINYWPSLASAAVMGVFYIFLSINGVTLLATAFSLYVFLESTVTLISTFVRLSTLKKDPKKLNFDSRDAQYAVNQDIERQSNRIKDWVKIGVLVATLMVNGTFGLLALYVVAPIYGLIGFYLFKRVFRFFQRKMYAHEYDNREFSLEKNPLVVHVGKMRTIIEGRMQLWQQQKDKASDRTTKDLMQSRIDFWESRLGSLDDTALSKEFLELTRKLEHYTTKHLGGLSHVTYFLNYLVIEYPEFLEETELGVLQKAEVNKRIKLLYYLIQTELDKFGVEADVKQSAKTPDVDHMPKDRLKVEVINKVYRFLLEERPTTSKYTYTKPNTDAYIFRDIFKMLEEKYADNWYDVFERLEENMPKEKHLFKWQQNWKKSAQDVVEGPYHDALLGEGLGSVKSRFFLFYRAYKRERNIPIFPHRISVGTWNVCIFLWPVFGAFAWIAGFFNKPENFKKNTILKVMHLGVYTVWNLLASTVLGAVLGTAIVGIGFTLTGAFQTALTLALVGGVMGAGIGVLIGLTLTVAVYVSPYLGEFVKTSPKIDKENRSDQFVRSMNWRIRFENIVMHGGAMASLVISGVFAVITFLGAASITAPFILKIIFPPAIVLLLVPLTYLSLRLIINTAISHWTAEEKIISKIKTDDDILFYFKECMQTIEQDCAPAQVLPGETYLKNFQYRRMIDEMYKRNELSPEEYDDMREAESTYYLKRVPKSDEAQRQIKQFLSQAFMDRVTPTKLSDVKGFSLLLPAMDEACDYYMREIACAPLKEGEVKTPLGQMITNYPIEWKNLVHKMVRVRNNTKDADRAVKGISKKGRRYLLSLPVDKPLNMKKLEKMIEANHVSKHAIHEIEHWFSMRQMYISHTMDAMQNYYQVYEDIAKYRLGYTSDDSRRFANSMVQIVLKHDKSSTFYDWKTPGVDTAGMVKAKKNFIEKFSADTISAKIDGIYMRDGKTKYAVMGDLQDYINGLTPLEFAYLVYQLQYNEPQVDYTIMANEKEEQWFRMVGYFARHPGALIRQYVPEGSEEQLFDTDMTAFSLRFPGNDTEVPFGENIDFPDGTPGMRTNIMKQYYNEIDQDGKTVTRVRFATRAEQPDWQEASLRDIPQMMELGIIPFGDERGIMLVAVIFYQMLRGSKLGGMSNGLGFLMHASGQMTDCDTDTRYAEIMNVPSEYLRMSKQPQYAILLSKLHVFNEHYSGATKVFAFAENVWAKNVQRSMRHHRSLLGYGKFLYVNWDYVRMFSGMEADDIVSEDSGQASAMKAEGLEVDHSEIIASRQGFEVTYAQATAPLNKYPAGTVELLLRNILPDLASPYFSMAQRMAIIEAPMHYYKKVFVGWAIAAVMVLGFLLPFMPMKNAGPCMVMIGLIFAQSVNLNGWLYFVERYGKLKGTWEFIKIMPKATAYFTPFISAYGLAVKRGLEGWAKFVTSAKTVAVQLEPFLNILTRDFSAAYMGSLLLVTIVCAPFGIYAYAAFAPFVASAFLMTFGRFITTPAKTPWRNLLMQGVSSLFKMKWQLNVVKRTEDSPLGFLDPSFIPWGRFGHVALWATILVPLVLGVMNLLPATVIVLGLSIPWYYLAIGAFALVGSYVSGYFNIIPNTFAGRPGIIATGLSMMIGSVNIAFSLPKLIHKVFFLGTFMLAETVVYIAVSLLFRVVIDWGAWISVPAGLYLAGFSLATCAIALGGILVGGLMTVFLITAFQNRVAKEAKWKQVLVKGANILMWLGAGYGLVISGVLPFAYAINIGIAIVAVSLGWFAGIKNTVATLGLGITPLRIIGLYHNSFGKSFRITATAGTFLGLSLFWMYPVIGVAVSIFGLTAFPAGGYIFGVLAVLAIPFIPVFLTTAVLLVPALVMLLCNYSVLKVNIASRGVGRIIHYLNDLTLEAGKESLAKRISKLPGFITRGYEDLIMHHDDVDKKKAKDAEEKAFEKNLFKIIEKETAIIPVTAAVPVVAEVEKVQQQSDESDVRNIIAELNATRGLVGDVDEAQIMYYMTLLREEREKLKKLNAPAQGGAVTGEFTGLRIKTGFRSGDKVDTIAPREFVPSNKFSSDQRVQLGLVRYDELLGDATLYRTISANQVTKMSCYMDAGLGTSLGRTEKDGFLEKTAKKVHESGLMIGKAALGSKGTDLFYFLGEIGGDDKIAVAETKINALIVEARKQEYYGQSFRPLINVDSAPAYYGLLDSICYEDRQDSNIAVSNKRTYRQVMQELGIVIEPFVFQADMPFTDTTGNVLTMEQLKKDGELDTSKFGPANHGQFGFQFIGFALNHKVNPDGNEVVIASFANGDNTNSELDPLICGWMASKRIPIVMVSTDREGIDGKGGMIGVTTQRLANGIIVPVKTICELAQAKESQKFGIDGQVDHFAQTGLSDDEATYGKQGAQDFNTNIHGLNLDLLSLVLNDLKAYYYAQATTELSAKGLSQDLIKKEAEKMAIDAVFKAACPDVMAKENGQLEGAIASVMLNLDTFCETNDFARAILNKHKIPRLLTVLNVGKENRIRFFTPIKTALDYVLQINSDFFKLNTETFKVEKTKDVPLPHLAYGFKRDKNYGRVQFLLDYWGYLRIQGLTKLDLGDEAADVPTDTITFKATSEEELDVELIGEVSIHNYSGKEQCISVLLDKFSGSEGVIIREAQDGKPRCLVLKNVKIEIDKEEKVTITSLSKQKAEIIPVTLAVPVVSTVKAEKKQQRSA